MPRPHASGTSPTAKRMGDGSAQLQHSTLPPEVAECIKRQHEELEGVLRDWIIKHARLAGLGQADGPYQPVQMKDCPGHEVNGKAESSGLRGEPKEEPRAEVEEEALDEPEGGEEEKTDQTPGGQLDKQGSRWELTDKLQFERLKTQLGQLGPVAGSQDKGDRTSENKPSESGVDGIMLRISRMCSKLIARQVFDIFFGAVIILNGILVGVEVQHSAVFKVDEAPSYMTAFGYVFSVLFVLELLIRIFAHGRRFFRTFDWGWNVFDLIAVCSSIMEIVLTGLVSDSMSFLLLTRIIRIVRVVRLLRLLRFLRELKTMVWSIIHTLPSLCWSVALMCLIIYMFAIVLTEAVSAHLIALLRDGGPLPSYFDDLDYNWGTLAYTMYTLFMSMSGGINWGIPASTLTQVGSYLLWMFMAFQCVMTFALLNVITGFFCEHAIDMAQQDKENMVAEQLRDKESYKEFFRELFEEIDEDNSGGISLQELEIFLYDDRLQAIFAHLNINVLNAWTIFRLLDTNADGEVSIEEFVTGLMRIRGPAKTIDVRSVHHDIKRNQKIMTEFMEFSEQRFQDLENRIICAVQEKPAVT